MQSVIQRISVFVAVLLVCVQLFAAERVAVPPLVAPVMDTAQMMSSQARQALNEHLLQYSREKGSQIVVLTVPKISPETPFDYAARVMAQWQLGRENISDGVLLLLVRDERKTHLAVGRGLEGAIPDVYAKRILEDVVRPYLHAKQVDAGIVAAVGQIEKLIAGEALPEVSYSKSKNKGNGLVFLFILPFIAGGFLKAVFGRTLGSLFSGGAMFVVALLMGWNLLLAVLAAVACTVLAFMAGNAAFVSGGGSSFGGGSGGIGSGRWGGGRSGGGFRGGGGSFGGGGASGGW